MLKFLPFSFLSLTPSSLLPPSLLSFCSLVPLGELARCLSSVNLMCSFIDVGKKKFSIPALTQAFKVLTLTSHTFLLLSHKRIRSAHLSAHSLSPQTSVFGLENSVLFSLAKVAEQEDASLKNNNNNNTAS